MVPKTLGINTVEEIGPIAAELKPLYLKVWHNILEAFLGWSPHRVEEWASKWEGGLSGTRYIGWFYHETATSYVVPLLIPPALWARLPVRERNHLEGRIEQAITLGNSTIEFASDHDWHAAKSRVEAILREYGETLPAVIQGGENGDREGGDR